MTNEEIRAFIEVCRQRNISEAAEKLYISQPSLSTRLKFLEREVGCRLLIRERGRREIALTEEGKRFYKLALQYENIVHQMLVVGKKDDQTIFRVASINSIGTYMLVPVYEHFLGSRPDVRLVIQDMESVVGYRSVKEGRTDLAFSVYALEDAEVACKFFCTEPMALVCSWDSNYSERVKLSDLDTRREIYTVWFRDFELWHQEVFGGGAAIQLSLEIMGQLKHFLMKKNNWAIAPVSVARGLSEDGAVKICELDFSVPQREIYALYRRDDEKLDLVREFLARLTEELKQEELRKKG